MRKTTSSILIFVLVLLSNSAISQVQSFDDTKVNYKVYQEENFVSHNYKSEPKERQNLIKYLFDSFHSSWYRHETEIDFEKKKKIILSLGRESFFNEQLDGYGKEAYASHYHFIDLNGDSDLDIVYNGFDGADDKLIFVWINIDGKYHRILSEIGSVKSLQLNKLESILLIDTPCSHEEYYGSFKKVKIYNNLAETVEQYTYHEETVFPSDYYDIYSFITINERYNLRKSPVIKNKPCVQFPEPY